jgi:hypothetical protein
MRGMETPLSTFNVTKMINTSKKKFHELIFVMGSFRWVPTFDESVSFSYFLKKFMKGS